MLSVTFAQGPWGVRWYNGRGGGRGEEKEFEALFLLFELVFADFEGMAISDWLQGLIAKWLQRGQKLKFSPTVRIFRAFSDSR